MSLSVKTATTRPAKAKVDILLLPVDSRRRFGASVPARLRDFLVREMRRRDFTAGWNSSLLVAQAPGVAAQFVALVGFGDVSKQTPNQVAEAARRGVAQVVQQARSHGAHSMAINLWDQPSASVIARAAYEGAALATYRFTDYSDRLQKEQKKQALNKITVLVSEDNKVATKREITQAAEILPGVELARNLVNQPAQEVTPRRLVEEAHDIAKASPGISVSVLNKSQAARQNFNAMLAVARGSDEEPYVIHLFKKPTRGPEPAKKIFLIGKGITFDSGGIEVKPADGMRDMKMDMAGAATVLGVFSVLGKLELPFEVHGVIAACENMPSGKAFRPGDVLRSKSGKTIEVGHTDAEGRLTLADAITYAREQEADVIIDLATLTGACVVALGDTHAGLFSNDGPLAKALLAAARSTGEGLAQLPLPSEYKSLIKSEVADISNDASPRIAGAITAALFLKEFVGKAPWAHLDIAGPAFADRDALSYNPKGGTGYGVRTLVEFLRDYKPFSAE